MAAKLTKQQTVLQARESSARLKVSALCNAGLASCLSAAARSHATILRRMGAHGKTVRREVQSKLRKQLSAALKPSAESERLVATARAQCHATRQWAREVMTALFTWHGFLAHCRAAGVDLARAPAVDSDAIGSTTRAAEDAATALAERADDVEREMKADREAAQKREEERQRQEQEAAAETARRQQQEHAAQRRAEAERRAEELQRRQEAPAVAEVSDQRTRRDLAQAAVDAIRASGRAWPYRNQVVRQLLVGGHSGPSRAIDAAVGEGYIVPVAVAASTERFMIASHVEANMAHAVDRLAASIDEPILKLPPPPYAAGGAPPPPYTAGLPPPPYTTNPTSARPPPYAAGPPSPPSDISPPPYAAGPTNPPHEDSVTRKVGVPLPRSVASKALRAQQSELSLNGPTAANAPADRRGTQLLGQHGPCAAALTKQRALLETDEAHHRYDVEARCFSELKHLAESTSAAAKKAALDADGATATNATGVGAQADGSADATFPPDVLEPIEGVWGTHEDVADERMERIEAAKRRLDAGVLTVSYQADIPIRPRPTIGSNHNQQHVADVALTAMTVVTRWEEPELEPYDPW